MAANKDKVDLSGLNKVKKQTRSQKMKNPLKKQKGPVRDSEGKFTSGSGGLRQLNFNWKRALPVVLIVALAGGFLVYRGLAKPGTGYSHEQLNTALSVSVGKVKETRSSKRNAQVVEIANASGATNAKAVFDREVEPGNWKACLMGVPQKGIPRISVVASAQSTTLGTATFTAQSSQEYKELGCMTVNHTGEGHSGKRLRFTVNNLTADTAFRVSSILLTPAGTTPPTPALKTTLYGTSIGAGDPSKNAGWDAIESYTRKVGAPSVIRTYAASWPNQPNSALSRYPGVPLVIGPKSIGWSDAKVIEALNIARKTLDATGEVVITPNPEHDRHIRKSGWKLDDVVRDFERWYQVTAKHDPGLLDHLWVNPTGYQASVRFPSEVNRILPYVAGVAVDGYTFASESPLTQASLDDSRWAKAYADRNSKRFSMLEQGVEAGPRQADQLAQMLAVVKELNPDHFIYWDTGGDGQDFRLSDASAEVLRNHIQSQSTR